MTPRSTLTAALAALLVAGAAPALAQVKIGATGALGGAKLTNVNPGEQATLRFKADRSGTFV